MDNKIFKITKNTIIGFFTLVFILGFFSKSVVNLFLPKVQVESPINGSLLRTLNIQGNIVPKETLKVRLPGNVIVEEYFVKIGEQVRAEAPLFRINKNYGIKSSYESIEQLRIKLEKEQLRLKKLQETTYEIDEMNITLLEEKVSKRKKEVKNQEILYNAGTITASQLENSKESLRVAEVNLRIEKIKAEEKRLENILVIKEALDNIEKLKKEILEFEEMKEFYSDIGDDGIHYSETDGIVLVKAKPKSIVYQDSILIELGLVEKYDSVKLIGQIPEENYSFVADASIIKIESEDKNIPNIASITSVGKVVDNRMITLEAEFRSDEEGSPIINKEINGIIEKKYRGENIVPKAAVIVYDDYEVGAKGYIYVVSEEKGALGVEYIAEKIDITIKGVGDYSVDIDGINNFKDPRVIVNPSYKIRDGVKVRI